MCWVVGSLDFIQYIYYKPLVGTTPAWLGVSGLVASGDACRRRNDLRRMLWPSATIGCKASGGEGHQLISVDGQAILHHLAYGLSQYLQGFIYLKWCKISSINRRGADGMGRRPTGAW
jgi:hypothetical protein